MVLPAVLGALALSALAYAAPFESGVQPHTHNFRATTVAASKNATTKPQPGAKPAPFCYPALGFVPPFELPEDNTDWWCDPATEYAFVGFSYEVTACQSRAQLHKEFADIRYHFRSRYVRLYGACDQDGFYDDIADAAWANGLGVHALVWFGFNGDDVWISRRDTLFAALHANPLAKFVTRVVQFGSEPLYDNVLPHDQLAEQVVLAKQNLSSLNIPVTVSELAYGYQERGGAQDVLDAIDSINIHMLPFFSQNASTSDQAWPLVLNDLDWFIAHGNGKKMYFDENGWPSVTSPSVQPNSPDAVADIPNEHGYYVLLDQHCEDLKAVVGGGIGWFAHIYSDNQEPGYGIYNSSGHMKFPFAPRTFC
ncbi:glycoside hydrolase superfamily [Dichomitus squalens]|uniref:glucan endo-1,3-beta-D-glucosidase n=1 Tax=Dichomitus squalens TaxID=114155 RepID=A0A4V2K3S3_9APHY|nr:glycoside hydrolase superfamily [Dichomitus squalens]TBU64293.1 glycoside hydrolase superfamily [Dichomitus squalens]